MDNSPLQRLTDLPGPILVTGHTGFKGTWMSFILEHLKLPMVGFSLPADKDSLYQRSNRVGTIPEVFADIRDYEVLGNFLDQFKPSTIIHMAAQSLVLNSYENPRETFDINVMGTVNVLDLAFKSDYVKAIIIVTTDKVYKNENNSDAFIESDPLEGKDPYSASKVGTESVVAAWQQIRKINGGPKLISVRAGNVIGGGDFAADRIIPDLVRGYLTGKVVRIRNPHSKRPWQHVLDPLFGYLAALEKLLSDEFEENLNFGPLEENMEVKDVVNKFAEYLPIEIMEHIGNHSEISTNSMEALDLSLNSTLAGSLIQWRPKWSQEKAISVTGLWWKNYLNLNESPAALCQRDICAYLE